MTTGNAVLVIVYHLLSDPTVRFRDLGADHFDTHIDKHPIHDGKAIIAETAAA